MHARPSALPSLVWARRRSPWDALEERAGGLRRQKAVGLEQEPGLLLIKIAAPITSNAPARPCENFVIDNHYQT